MNNVGLTLVEGIANGATPITEPSKRNLGLLMIRERGPANTPIIIDSLAQDRAIFGGTGVGYGAYITRNIFKNAGGFPVTIVGVRVLDEDSAEQASVVVASLLSATNFSVFAANKGQADFGAWGNNLKCRLFNYDSKAPGRFVFEVIYKGSLVESFSAQNGPALVSDINTNSGYVSVSFSGNLMPNKFSGVGTLDASDTSDEVEFSSNQSANIFAGNKLYDSNGDLIGTVKSVATDGLSAILITNALVTAADSSFTFDGYKILQLSGGTDGVYPIESKFYPSGSVSEPRGLKILDGANIQLVACSEYHTATMAQQLRDYASGETQGNIHAIVNTPYDASESVVETFTNSLVSATRSHISMYEGWGRTSDENGGYVWVPLIGGIFGAAYIRTTALQGDYIHIPPGGVDSYLTDFIEIKTKVKSQQTINRYVQDLYCNVVRFRTGIGWYVASSRTCSSNPLFHSTHIALTTNFYIAAFDNSFQWTTQKTNNDALHNELKVSLDAYGRTQYGQGALEDSVSFEEAWKVINDASVNPPTQDRKLHNCIIEWIPSECTESVKISLNRNDGYLISKFVTQ